MNTKIMIYTKGYEYTPAVTLTVCEEDRHFLELIILENDLSFKAEPTNEQVDEDDF